MKKAAFIGSSKVFDVYTPELVEEMKSTLDFSIPAVLKRDNLEEYKEETVQLTYLFSTWGMFRITEEEVKTYFPNVKAIFYAAGSVQMFARSFLNQGKEVFSAWGANAVPVAEFTFAEILLANKGFFHHYHIPGSGNEWEKMKGGAFSGNFETTVGIVGAGMIGRLVIEKLHSVDKFRILVFDPFLPDEKAAELGVEKVDLITLFRESDVISNHLANNPRTVKMLNADCFNAMKPYATFINTGRGAQVDEDAMIAALKECPTRCALLDVTSPEPPAPESELYLMKNVILTPHIAGSLYNEIHRMAEYMWDEYKALDAGQATKYSVSLKMLETMA